jgi:hypothetical protein
MRVASHNRWADGGEQRARTQRVKRTPVSSNRLSTAAAQPAALPRRSHFWHVGRGDVRKAVSSRTLFKDEVSIGMWMRGSKRLHLIVAPMSVVLLGQPCRVQRRGALRTSQGSLVPRLADRLDLPRPCSAPPSRPYAPVPGITHSSGAAHITDGLRFRVATGTPSASRAAATQPRRNACPSASDRVTQRSCTIVTGGGNLLSATTESSPSSKDGAGTVFLGG